MIVLYNILTVILLPLYPVVLLIRLVLKKEIGARILEKFGIAGCKRPTGEVLWCHGASVGESIAALSLIQEIQKTYPDAHILLTTGTKSSANLMAKQLPDGCTHQFLPMDNALFVWLFLKHWQPKVCLLMESELWPSLLSVTSKYCPILLLNARMSPQSVAKWQKYRSFVQTLLGYINHILCQTVHDHQSYQSLMLDQKKAIYVGNLKYDTPPLSVNAEALKLLQDQIAKRPVLLAVSTHGGEEDIILQTDKHLRQNHDDLLTIIVPRHPERRDEIIDLAQAQGKTILRSENTNITADTSIYIADTFGEMGLFLRLAPAVFVGGSLVPQGGHNILEPAQLGCMPITGAHMFNFAEIYDDFCKENAVITVQNASELAQAFETIWTSGHDIDLISVAAQKQGAIGRTMKVIADYA